MQIWENLNLDSSDEEEDMGAQKPDSTQQGATGTGSDAGSGHIPCSGVVHKKPKRKHIDSELQPSVKQDNTPTNISDDSETELDKLIRTRLRRSSESPSRNSWSRGWKARLAISKITL